MGANRRAAEAEVKPRSVSVSNARRLTATRLARPSSCRPRPLRCQTPNHRHKAGGELAASPGIFPGFLSRIGKFLGTSLGARRRLQVGFQLDNSLLGPTAQFGTRRGFANAVQQPQGTRRATFAGPLVGQLVSQKVDFTRACCLVARSAGETRMGRTTSALRLLHRVRKFMRRHRTRTQARIR